MDTSWGEYKMMISALEKLKRFYAQFSADDNVLVVINADPDSIASAMAVKRLLWHRVAVVSISNINIIKRPDNLAIIGSSCKNYSHSMNRRAKIFPFCDRGSKTEFITIRF